MKRLPLLFIALFIVLATGSAIYLKQNNNKVEPANQNQPPGSQTTPKSTAQATSSGSYVNYDEEVISKTTGKKVLFFHAPWCSQCRSIEAGIKNNGAPEGWTVIKVDYDSNQALRQKYGVTLQTTFVKVDDTGEKTDLYVAYDEPTIEAVNRNFLD